MNVRVRTVIALLAVGTCVHFLINRFSPSNIFTFSGEFVYEEPEKIEWEVFGKTLMPPVDRNDTISALLSNGSMRDTNDTLTKVSYLMSFPPENLPLCPVHPPGLVGPIRVFLDEPDMNTLEVLYSHVESGGHGQPTTCKSRHRVAIIIPYRDRMAHLKIFLHNMHSLLSKQQLDYAIFIVEPIPKQTFNRAKLMNVGYIEALELYSWDCFIFHDVDLMPEDDRNLYSCPQQPRHMSVAIDKFSYKLPYGSIFGGICALSKTHFETLNGFSNDYWGWGGEDDDMSSRVIFSGYKIARYPVSIARYKMIKHTHEKESNPINKCRHKLMKKTQIRYKKDGLFNLKYNLQNVTRFKLYTHIVVDLLEEESRAELAKDGFKDC